MISSVCSPCSTPTQQLWLTGTWGMQVQGWRGSAHLCALQWLWGGQAPCKPALHKKGILHLHVCGGSWGSQGSCTDRQGRAQQIILQVKQSRLMMTVHPDLRFLSAQFTAKATSKADFKLLDLTQPDLASWASHQLWQIEGTQLGWQLCIACLWVWDQRAKSKARPCLHAHTRGFWRSRTVLSTHLSFCANTCSQCGSGSLLQGLKTRKATIVQGGTGHHYVFFKNRPPIERMQMEITELAWIQPASRDSKLKGNKGDDFPAFCCRDQRLKLWSLILERPTLTDTNAACMRSWTWRSTGAGLGPPSQSWQISVLRFSAERYRGDIFVLCRCTHAPVLPHSFVTTEHGTILSWRVLCMSIMLCARERRTVSDERDRHPPGTPTFSD